jgi:hypothetical protein
MSTATYLSTAALDQLGQAQTVIDMHLTFSRGGWCGLCKEADPCARRLQAEELFARYGRLPRRTPGLTFADASRWSAGRWLDEATAQRIADAVEEPNS